MQTAIPCLDLDTSVPAVYTRAAVQFHMKKNEQKIFRKLQNNELLM